MRYRISIYREYDITYPTYDDGLNTWVTEVEAPMPGQAAKLFAEHGWRGHCTIWDEYGQSSMWSLESATIHYAYPVLDTESQDNG